MINEAIAKITEEMMKEDHPFAVFIEEHLTSICTNEKVAGKLLEPDKSLNDFVEKTIDEMSANAKKK